VPEAAGNDERRGVVDAVSSPAARDRDPHDAGATGKDDHRPVVDVNVLVEADAALVGDPHGRRQVDELVQGMALRRRLEAPPLRMGELHVTILAK
jgi:hypothetical protein